MQDNTAFPDLAALTPQQIETKAVEAGSVKAGMSPAKAFLLATMAGFFVGADAIGQAVIACR